MKNSGHRVALLAWLSRPSGQMQLFYWSRWSAASKLTSEVYTTRNELRSYEPYKKEIRQPFSTTNIKGPRYSLLFSDSQHTNFHFFCLLFIFQEMIVTAFSQSAHKTLFLASQPQSVQEFFPSERYIFL